jgi:hypothetical protein
MRSFLYLIAAMGFLWLVDMLAFDARYSAAVSEARLLAFNYEVNGILKNWPFDRRKNPG